MEKLSRARNQGIITNYCPTTSSFGGKKTTVSVFGGGLKGGGVGGLCSLVTELTIFSIIAEMKLVAGGLDGLGMDNGGAAGIMQSLLGYV